MGIERDISEESSKSSDEESPSSSVCTSEGIPVVSKSISSCGNDFFKSEELNDPKTPTDLAMNVEEPMNKVSLEANRRTGDYPLTSSKENNDIMVVESPNPRLSDENLDVDEK